MVFEEVRIENTNQCGYRCFCCPREGLSRPRGVMSLDDFRLVLELIGSHSGAVDLHGFGEPLLDPALVERVALAREMWPSSTLRIITTLGVRMAEEQIARLATCGLSVIEVSFYGDDRRTYQEMHGTDRFEIALRNLVALAEASMNVACPPAIVIRSLSRSGAELKPMTGLPRPLAALVAAGTIRTRTPRVLHNFGNGRTYNRPQADSVCSVVWGYRRRVLQIT